MDILSVLITTGTAEEYDFSRLLKIIDELCDSQVLLSNDLIVQSNRSTYLPKNFEVHSMFSRAKFEQVLQDADYLISHAGTGSVISALKAEKRVILFPRLAEYGEHIDNHQLEISKVFEEKGFALVAKDKEDLIMCINKIGIFQPEKFQSNILNFVNVIEEILKDTLENERG